MSSGKDGMDVLVSAARDRVRSLKAWASPSSDMYTIPVSFEGRTVASLRPVVPATRERTLQDASRWVRWRNENREAFFTWQEFTLERTLRWMESEYAQNDGDLMFFVETISNLAVGTLSLVHLHDVPGECELGRVLRGERGGPAGIMTAAVRCICAFAAAELNVLRIYLDVFESNAPAIRLYRRSGFRILRKYDLVMEMTPEGVCWVASSAGGSAGAQRMSALRMVWEADRGGELAGEVRP